MVGEFVVVENFVPVPATPEAVLGLFSLRGEPVALLDLVRVLGLPSNPRSLPATPSAVVVRTDVLHGAILVDRLHAVASGAPGTFTEAGPEEPPVIAGFCPSPKDGQLMTVLRSDIVLERIRALRVSVVGSH
jgi:chemotaxis signal transduction protein